MCSPKPRTVEGTSDKPGYLPGYGVLPAAMVTELAAARHAAAGHRSQRSCRRTQLPPLGGAGPVHPLPRSDHAGSPAATARRVAAISTTPCPTRTGRPTVEQQAVLPNPSPAQDLLHRARRLDRTQRPDGTIVWTSPRGRTYTTTPGGALFFPQLAVPTGELILPSTGPPHPNRGLAMPTRKRTRSPRPRLPGAMGTRPQPGPLRGRPTTLLAPRHFTGCSAVMRDMSIPPYEPPKSAPSPGWGTRCCVRSAPAS